MKESIFHLSGLHCRSCELLIEHEVKKIPGISSLKVSHKNGILHIFSEKPLSKNLIEKAVTQAGYAIANPEEKAIKKVLHKETLLRDTIIGIIIALLVWYLVPGLTKVLDPTGGITENTGLIVAALITGLAAGVSTCMAISGGLVMAVSAEADTTNTGNGLSQKSLRAQLLFHIGRILAFGVGGLVLGLLGTAAQLSDMFIAVLSFITAFILLRLGISMTDIFPGIKAISIPLPSRLKNKLSHSEAAKKAPALIGALTFFLPCGFTLAIELAVMKAGNPTLGAISMMTFVLGTTPGLLILGLAASWKGKARASFLRVVGWIITTFAIVALGGAWNIYSLANIKPNDPAPLPIQVVNSGSTEPTNTGAITPVIKEKGSISIALTQNGQGYSPQVLQIPRNMHVQLVVTSTNPYTCAADFTIPELGIHKLLDQGINTFEFDTPDEAKNIWFGCGMRMFQGMIEVR